MLRKSFIFFLPVAALFIMIRCDKELETLVGSGFFDRENKGSIHYASFQVAPSDTFYQTQIRIKDSPYLYVGETSGIKTKSLLQFSGGLTEGAQVDSARVTFYTRRPIGADQGILTASIHLIDTDWEYSDLTWNRVENEFIGQEIATLDFNAGEMNMDDTLTFSFLVPKEIVQAWMDTTQDVNHGLILNYTDPSFMVQLFGTHVDLELGLWPVMDMYYTLNDSQKTVTLTTFKDTYVAMTDQEPTQDFLVVSSGVSFRPVMYFDVSSIDDQATINKAELILFADTTQSFPLPNEDYYPLDAFAIENPDDIFNTESPDSIPGYITADSLVLNITYYVQRWTIGQVENHGLFLKARYEPQILQQRSFISSAFADTTLRPKLYVYYSLPPSGRL